MRKCKDASAPVSGGSSYDNKRSGPDAPRRNWRVRLIALSVVATSVPLSPAFAEVCDKVRPNWSGDPTSALGELVHYIYTTPGLIVAGVLAVVLLTRLRYTAIAGAAVALSLAGLAVFEHFSTDEVGQIGQAAQAEGCVGSPWLVVVVLTLCALLMLAFARPRRGSV